MATEPVIRSSESALEISDSLRKLLNLRETETHYLVRTLTGAILMRPKEEIQYSWELLGGIMDDGKNTTEERSRERAWELAHDERKFGIRPTQ